MGPSDRQRGWAAARGRGEVALPIRPPLNRPNAKRERDRRHDAKRRADNPWRAWYKTAAWQQARKAKLSEQPLCERHLARGEIVPATVVNHRKAHKGDWALFIDPANHESTCETCHNRDIQREERGRPVQAIGVDGWPVEYPDQKA